MKTSKSSTTLHRSPLRLAPAIVPIPFCGLLCAGVLVGAPPRDAIAQAAAKVAQGGPVVAIMQPSYADTLRGTVSVVLGIQARRYAPKTVEMFVDGKSATAGPVEIDAMASIAFNWDTTIFTDGLHRLTVRVTDAQSFIGQSEVQVYINNGKRRDITAPKLRWLGFNNGDMLKGSVRLGVQASDDFGVKYVFLSINPSATPDRKPAMKAYLLNRPPYEVVFDSTSVPDGIYVLNALALDALENQGHASQRLFGVQNNGLNPTMRSRLDDMVRGTPDETPVVTPPVVPPGSDISHAPNDPPPLPVNGGIGADPDTRIVINPDGGSKTPGTDGNSRPPRSLFVPPSPDILTHVPRRQDGALSPGSNRQRVVLNTPSASLFDPALPDFGLRRMPIRPTNPADIGTTRVASSLFAPLVSGGSIGRRMSPAKPVAPSPVERITVPNLQARTLTRVAIVNVAKPVEVKPNVVKPVVVQPAVVKPVAPQPVGVTPADAKPGISQPAGIDASVPQPVVPQPVVVAPPLQYVFPAGNPVTPMPSSVGSRIASVPASLIEHSNPMRSTSLNSIAPRTAPQIVMPRIAGLSEMTPMEQGGQSRIASPALNLPPVDIERTAPAMRGSGLFAMIPPPVAPRSHRRAAITIAPVGGIVPAAYVARGGETLSSIAARFGCSTATLAQVNGLTPHAKLAKGTKIALLRAITVSYKGKPLEGDVSGVMVGSTSAAAFRFLFEAQGGTVTWDHANRRVLAQNGAQQVTLTIGSRTATVNEQKVMLDMAAFLLSGRTMVPVRFFEKSLHAQVQWEPSTNRLMVSIANPSVG